MLADSASAVAAPGRRTVAVSGAGSLKHAVAQGQYGADQAGLIAGYRFIPGEPGREIDSDTAAAWLASADESGDFVWLHFNLAHAACERWLHSRLALPEAFFEAVRAGPGSTRIEHVPPVLLAVINDVTFEFGATTLEIATLQVCAQRRLLVTTRATPLRSVDRLRAAVKNRERFHSPLALLVHLLRDQADVLMQIVRESATQVDAIEDRLLAQRLHDSRTELAALRRSLVRVQRLLAPEPGSLFRLLNRPPDWLRERDVDELRTATEECALVLNDLHALVERIKLLQEELAATLNEQTNRTLFVLTMVTVLALPINIVAGFFGMNVGGVPLADNPHGFWLLVALVAGFTLLAARWAFRKRS